MLSAVDVEGGMRRVVQYSCLENPTDRGARWATVHAVAETSREPSVSGNFCGRIKGVKNRFALKDRTWDFPGDAGNFGVPLE